MAKIDKSWKMNGYRVDGLEHIQTVLSFPLEYYQKRIQKIGFVDKESRLLDAACGSGVWAVAAAKYNREVSGIDSTEKYLAVAKEIKKKLEIRNLKLEIGRLERLPYPDDYFDNIICYNAWMYTDRVKSLVEMSRVLKPGGKIYLGCIANLGYYLLLFWQAVKTGNRSLMITAFKAMVDKVYLSQKEAKKLLKNQDFEIVKLSLTPESKLKNNWYLYEIIAQKEKN